MWLFLESDVESTHSRWAGQIGREPSNICGRHGARSEFCQLQYFGLQCIMQVQQLLTSKLRTAMTRRHSLLESIQCLLRWQTYKSIHPYISWRAWKIGSRCITNGRAYRPTYRRHFPTKEKLCPCTFVQLCSVQQPFARKERASIMLETMLVKEETSTSFFSNTNFVTIRAKTEATVAATSRRTV